MKTTMSVHTTLFFPVVLSVSLPRLLNLLSGVNDVSMCNFIMVGRPLVISGLVVFSRLCVVMGGLGKIHGSFFAAFFDIGRLSLVWS